MPQICAIYYCLRKVCKKRKRKKKIKKKSLWHGIYLDYKVKQKGYKIAYSVWS
jgi:hypothetical protein